MSTDEHDGALPQTVVYRAFQQMYSTLHAGIQAGLSDVVNEVFAEGLISPHTKSVADNASIGEPSRASTILNSMLQRTKTCPETFTKFADALDSIPSFQYLATDMRNKLTTLKEQETERKAEYQKEAEKQEQKRQELQLRIVQGPKHSAIEPVPVVAHADSYTSPSNSTVRRIDMPLPQSPMIYDTPMKFNHGRSTSSTPGLDSFGKTARLTPDTTRPELGYAIAVAVDSSSRAVITDRKAAAAALVYTASKDRRTSIRTAVMPVPSQSTPVMVQHSFSESQPPLLSSSAPSKIPLSDIAISENSTAVCAEPPLPHEPCAKQDEKTTPSTCVNLPTPSSPKPPHIQQAEIDDGGACGLYLPHIAENPRSLSVESSCSHEINLSSLESECEVDSEQDTELPDSAHAQESVSTHDNESLVGVSTRKLHRSVSCEKCLKKMLRIKEQTIKDMEIERSQSQLDTTQQLAVYKSKTDKLLKESSALQNEVYASNYTVQQLATENEELHQHNNDLLDSHKAREDEICRLKGELIRVKADAFEMMSAALKNEKSKYYCCPTCNTVFH